MTLKEGGLRGSLRNVGVGVADIPDSVILQPLSDDLTHFSGGTGGYDINSNVPVFDHPDNNDLSLKYTDTTSDAEIGSKSGLSNYPSVGNTFLFRFYPDDAGARALIFYSVSNESAPSDGDGYYLSLQPGTDNFAISRRDGGSFNTLSETTFSWSVDVWYTVEVLHEADGSITATLYDNYPDSQVEQLTATDQTHLTSGQFDHSGIGIFAGLGETAGERIVFDQWVTE